jgi:ESS family glutamate:Na+ symporter
VELIDNKIIAFFSDFFMEVLVFAGIATIDLQIISDAILPLLLLFAAGFAWNLFCHFVIRPRLIDTDYSFEISILNFGMLNGTTGIGLMLLKMVDPEFKTRAAKIYAESAPFTSPFIGGGLITLSLPFLLNNQSPLKILAILITLMVIFYFAPFLLRRKK